MSLEQIKILKDEQTALNRKFAMQGKKLIVESIQTFLENNDEFHAVCWTQYAPHFNDGDACEFGINGLMFLLKKDVFTRLAREGYDSLVADDDQYEYDAEDGIFGEGHRYSLDESAESLRINKKFEDFASNFDGMDLMFLHAFGESQKVSVERALVYNEYYEHD